MLTLPRMSPSNDSRLAYAVYRSERLRALLPADKIEPLVAAYDRAVQMAAEAEKVTSATHDDAADVREAVRTGEPVDVAAAIERMARARSDEAARREAMQVFKALPADAHAEIRRCIDASEDDLWEGLAAQLSELLARAEPVVASLGDIKDADEAMEAEKVTAWLELKSISREYHDIRQSHRSLLAAEDTQVSGLLPTANAFFGRLADVAPAFFEEATSKPTDLMRRPVTDVPFDVMATDSLDHLRYVVQNRARLRPRIGRADEAMNTPIPLMPSGAVPAPREHGRPVPGSPEFEYGMARARNEAANRIAAERDDRAAGIFD